MYLILYLSGAFHQVLSMFFNQCIKMHKQLLDSNRTGNYHALRIIIEPNLYERRNCNARRPKTITEDGGTGETKDITQEVPTESPLEECKLLVESIQSRKKIMNLYFKNKCPKLERQYQQIIEWENNKDSS